MKRVLIVEDSRTQAAALSELLRGAGYQVEVAASGEEGRQRTLQGPVDVVISDVVMPGAIDGYELCRQIKEGPRRNLPVILLTSLADPLDIIRGLECGADNFLTKPYEPDHLLARLQTLLLTHESRVQSKLRVGVDVFFMGRTFTINSGREQILDLLVATFEDAVRQNRELRRREEELEVARQELATYAGSLQTRLQHVLASTPAIIYASRVKGGRFIPTWISESVSRFTGFSVDEALVPEWWNDHLYPEDRPRVLNELAALEAVGRLLVEYRFRTRDGTYRWFRDDCQLVRSATGDPVEVVGARVDITDERKLGEQVRLAQKIEAIGTLAGGVAHDFNNILAIIKGTADLALSTTSDWTSVREDLREISATVDRASALTRQLLAFGRKQVLEPQPLDLNTLVAGTLKMVERIMGEDIRLALDTATRPLTVHADPGQLEQVVVNLCANARDAMPHGGEVAIQTDRVVLDDRFAETHPWSRPGEYALLVLSDTGTGMDAATLERVFEPFFTTKALGRGTGLGLAVVYGIVKQHGGLIHVYSEPGQGTIFRVYLPIYSGDPEAIAADDVAEVVGGDETILLAEDDSVLRTTTTRLLESLGYPVVAVASGEEALRVLEARGDTIQLAIIDVVMPGIGGRQVFDHIQISHPGLRVIFTTGYSPGTSQIEPLRTLPADVLPKPYGLQALAHAVRRALDVRRPTVEGAAAGP